MHPIFFASKTLNDSQGNYITIEKEMLAVLFAVHKFRVYLVGSTVTICNNHSTIKYLMTKKNAKPRLIQWILLLQEFEDKEGSENQVAYHLSHLENKEI